MQLFSLVLLLLCVVTSASAEVYKWKDANGGTHFSSTPPTQSTTQVEKKEYDAPAFVPEKSTEQKIEEIKSKYNDRVDTLVRDIQRSSPPAYVPKKEYKTSASTTIRGNTVEISGRITGGEPCKNLTVSSFAKHPNGGIAHVSATAGSIGSGGSAIFSGIDKQYGTVPGSGWFVDKTYVRCND